MASWHGCHRYARGDGPHTTGIHSGPLYMDNDSSKLVANEYKEIYRIGGKSLAEEALGQLSGVESNFIFNFLSVKLFLENER